MCLSEGVLYSSLVFEVKHYSLTNTFIHWEPLDSPFTIPPKACCYSANDPTLLRSRSSHSAPSHSSITGRPVMRCGRAHKWPRSSSSQLSVTTTSILPLFFSSFYLVCRSVFSSLIHRLGLCGSPAEVEQLYSAPLCGGSVCFKRGRQTGGGSVNGVHVNTSK